MYLPNTDQLGELKRLCRGRAALQLPYPPLRCLAHGMIEHRLANGRLDDSNGERPLAGMRLGLPDAQHQGRGGVMGKWESWFPETYDIPRLSYLMQKQHGLMER